MPSRLTATHSRAPKTGPSNCLGMVVFVVALLAGSLLWAALLLLLARLAPALAPPVIPVACFAMGAYMTSSTLSWAAAARPHGLLARAQRTPGGFKALVYGLGIALTSACLLLQGYTGGVK